VGNTEIEMSISLRTVVVACIVCVWMLLNGCASRDTSTNPSDQTWTISGKTYLVGSKDPIGGVVVKCAGISTVSGADGSYQLRGIPGGTQIITAELPKAETYSKSVEVTSDITYFVFITVTYTNLSGYVSNAVDGPVNGAVVMIENNMTHTDISGHYQFTKLPRATDTLTITHPDYLQFQTKFVMTTQDTAYDVVLLRERSLSAVVSANTYLDQGRPSEILPVASDNGRLLLRANGYDSLGVYHLGIQQYILMTIVFPRLMVDDHVVVVEGSLQLYADSLPASFGLNTYLIGSSWTASATYYTQPALGALLSYGVIPKNSAPGYITMLGVDGLNQLLKLYRASGVNYGIELRGGTITSTAFYSSYASTNQPKLTMKVRY
jgi:hypothetical protein